MRLVALAFAVLLIGAGCAQQSVSAALPVAKVTIDAAQGQAQFTVEVASDDASQRLGLMYRTSMAPDAGMLFDFHRPQFVSFWMKNTILPLDMIFIRADGVISTIAEDTVPYSTASIRSTEPVRAVLEINAGRAHALGVKPGQTVHADIFDSR